MSKSNNKISQPCILIVEDDPDQMELLVQFVQTEIINASKDTSFSAKQITLLRNIQIIKASNISAMKKAVQLDKNIILAILDCNLPDTKDSPSHDQLIKTNHRITGQHKPVDIILQHKIGTPITMISSLNRFQTLVSRFYKTNFSININFISKNEQPLIQKNIGYNLRLFLFNKS